MKRMKNRGGLLTQAAAMMDLPAEYVAGVTRAILVGDSELRVENHRGILCYGTEEIHISGGSYVVKVTGCELQLRAMTGTELLITGHIFGIMVE